MMTSRPSDSGASSLVEGQATPLSADCVASHFHEHRIPANRKRLSMKFAGSAFIAFDAGDLVSPLGNFLVHPTP